MASPTFFVYGGDGVTVQQILDMIQMKYPHGYDNSQLITMLNDIQQRIFRTLYRPETATTYDIFIDNPFYPISIPPENIIDVVVNGEEYQYQNIEYGASSHYYYVTEDNCIGLFPTPVKDITSGLTVFHYMVPPTLNSVTDTPALDVAWHMLLVYHACRELAVIARDDMSNVFTTEINELEKQYYKSNRARPHQTLDVYGVGRGAW